MREGNKDSLKKVGTMKLSIPPIHPQFVYDQDGNKTVVLLKVNEFESLLEGLEDLYDLIRVHKIKQEQNHESFSLESVIEEILAKNNDKSS